MADYIYTVSKKQFFPLSPQADTIDISDVAHALSMLCRANGHFCEFHSVAQHCIECANEALARGLGSRIALACLLHDASEAYMSDVTTPVKNKLADYRDYENALIDIIYDKYIGGISDEEKAAVYEIDKALLYYEFLHYTGIELSEKPVLASEPVFEFEPFDKVREKYLDLFRRISAMEKCNLSTLKNRDLQNR